MEDVELYTKLATLPDNIKSEVMDFIDFLLNKSITIQQKNTAPKARFGSGRGLFKIKEGFDEPLEDFESYMNHE